MINPLRWIRADLAARRTIKSLIRDGAFNTMARGGLGLEDLWKRGLENLMVRGEVTDPVVQVGAVYSAINILMQAMASVEYKLHQNKTEVDDHPFYKLMEGPNDSLVGTQLMEGTVGWREMTGRSFWFMDGLAGRGDKRFPRRIQLLDPHRVKPKLVDGELAGWVYTPKNAAPQTLSVEEVVRFAYFDHRDPYGGLGPLEVARLQYSLSWKAGRMQERFYSNGGLPPFYVKIPKEAGEFSPEQMDALRVQFRERYLTMNDDKWTPPFMFRGAELATISIDQKNAEWLATAKLSTWDIFSIFGVPPEFAGYTEGAALGSGGVSTEAKRRLWGFRVRGMGQHIQSVLQNQFIDRFFPGLTLQFDWRAKYNEVMPEETRAAIDTALKLIGVGVKPKEAFRFLDMQIDAKGQPWLDEGWLPFNLQRASLMMEDLEDLPAVPTTEPSIIPPTQDPTTEDPAAPQGPPEDEGQPKDVANTMPIATTRGGWPSSETLRAALWQQRALTMEKSERRLLGDYRSFLRWLGSETLKNIDGRSAPAGVNHGVNLETQRAGAGAVPPDSEIYLQVTARTRAAIVQAIASGWNTAIEEIGGGVLYDENDPRVGALLRDSIQEIKGASSTVAGRVRATLKAGTDAGDSPQELAARVRAKITEAYNGQARVVARDRTGAAYEGAHFEGMKASGIEKHEWLSARDERVREGHTIDGEVANMGTAFSNGLTRPHDPRGKPGQVIQCRCVTLPILN